jgi:hypothetical protein
MNERAMRCFSVFAEAFRSTGIKKCFCMSSKGTECMYYCLPEDRYIHLTRRPLGWDIPSRGCERLIESVSLLEGHVQC